MALRRLQHPSSVHGNNLLIPEGIGDTGIMWKILKENRIPSSSMAWKAIYKQNEIYEYLLRCCVRYFRQLMGTPLASTTWSKSLDPRFAQSILDQILDGTFKHPS